MTRQEQFAAEMYSHARAAGLTDAQARVAVAQAALETGYGRSVKDNNYFGIKAGSSWKGPTQEFMTWEEVGGKRVNMRDKFRSYTSPVQAFKDWKSLMERRYPGVLTATTFADAVKALVKGGYATDSKYGSKLQSINTKIDTAIAAMPENPPIPTPRPENAVPSIMDQYAYAGQTRAAAPVSPTSPAQAYGQMANSLQSAGLLGLDGRGSYSAPVGQVERGGALAPAVSANDARAMAAYQDYGQSRAAAPVSPSPATDPARAMAAYQEYGASRAAAPANASPAVDPAKAMAAYQDYGMSRAYAPAEPTRTYEMRAPSPELMSVEQAAQMAAQKSAPPASIMDAVQSAAPGGILGGKSARLAAPATPATPAVPGVAPAVPATPAMPAAPIARALNDQQMDARSWTRPAGTPSFSPADVYAGRANIAADAYGNFVSRDPMTDMTAVTNKYGATTGMTPQGYQTAIAGPLGNTGTQSKGILDGLFSGMSSEETRGRMGSAMKGAMIGYGAAGLPGAVGGGLLGGILSGKTGEIGGSGGSGGILGGLFGGLFGGNTGGRSYGINDFPDAPAHTPGSGGWTQAGLDALGALSPAARDAVESGRGGLY